MVQLKRENRGRVEIKWIFTFDLQKLNQYSWWNLEDRQLRQKGYDQWAEIADEIEW